MALMEEKTVMLLLKRVQEIIQKEMNLKNLSTLIIMATGQ